MIDRVHEFYRAVRACEHPDGSWPGAEVVPLATELFHDLGWSTTGPVTPAPATQLVITRDQLEWWAGRPLSDDEVRRVADALPNASIPEAIAAIVDALKDDQD